MKKSVKISMIVIASLIVLGGAGIFFLTYNKPCNDRECFNFAMGKCDKASWINDAKDSTWQYQTKGRNFGCYFSKKYCNECEINVRLLQIKTGSIDTEKLQGLDMNCKVVFGYVGNPQDDLKRCSGELKEAMQDLIINRMHAYILQNVGKIGEELTKIV